MGAPHGHTLHFHGHSHVHRLPAHIKIVALLTFVLAVVLTPRDVPWAFAVHLGLLLLVIAVSRVPLAHLARRMIVETPFVVFALLLPVIATGPRVTVGPVTLSEAGLLAAWGLLAKGTLGVLASLVVASTTEAHDLVAGLERLRLPPQLVQILAFMVRYLDVVTGEMRRMALARAARGFVASNPRHWPVVASGAGALFIRSYERGERVHLAMLSRGYDGRMPDTGAAGAHTVGALPWLRGLAVSGAAALTAVTALTMAAGR
ncbi:cobalt ECF transporter T component CbiQ [Janibacter sp. G1551]|uniref:cobalt ECF transporter T component CbiQ n=1 Tax=Janibacter sp. G1551 TaxID=3420440 RepID=UPI003CFF2213